MALCKLGFIMSQYVWKLDFPDNFQWKPFTSNLNEICKTVYGIDGELNL
jgi:hypothetical protein